MICHLCCSTGPDKISITYILRWPRAAACVNYGIILEPFLCIQFFLQGMICFIKTNKLLYGYFMLAGQIQVNYIKICEAIVL